MYNQSSLFFFCFVSFLLSPNVWLTIHPHIFTSIIFCDFYPRFTHIHTSHAHTKPKFWERTRKSISFFMHCYFVHIKTTWQMCLLPYKSHQRTWRGRKIDKNKIQIEIEMCILCSQNVYKSQIWFFTWKILFPLFFFVIVLSTVTVTDWLSSNIRHSICSKTNGTHWRKKLYFYFIFCFCSLICRRRNNNNNHNKKKNLNVSPNEMSTSKKQK